MTILGMGPLEILVILILGFVVLGPDKMITSARTLGRFTGELRNLIEGLPKISLADELKSPKDNPLAPKTDAFATDVENPADPVEPDVNTSSQHTITFRPSSMTTEQPDEFDSTKRGSD
jgi:Sec-independent protein translocase protein TatA